MTMTTAEYDAYRTRVAAFIAGAGLANLSPGVVACDDCGTELECSACPDCGKDGGEIANEPYFSWRPCPVCLSSLGGDREDCHGYNPTTGAVETVEGVCGDCAYFLANGALPDDRMP